MNKKIFLLICILLLNILYVSGANSEEIKRSVIRTFKTTGEPQLSISNHYGRIDILEWNKNEIYVYIEIIAKSFSTKNAEKLINSVDFKMEQTNEKIILETLANSIKTNKGGITINYTVNVPKSTHLNLENKYGDIKIHETSQNFKAVVEFGNLSADQLKGEKNEITIKYGKISVLKASHLALWLSYSKAGIYEITDFTLTTAYSQLQCANIKNLTLLQSKYDKFIIQTLGNASISSAYSDFDIMTLLKTWKASGLKYCKININNISDNFDKIYIQSTYTSINLNLNNKLNAALKIFNKYGDIKTGDLRLSNLLLKEKDKFTKYIEGTIGNKNNPKANIDIVNSYANILLYK